MNNINTQKFPPERKHEFLNYVMIIYPKDEWSDNVIDYSIKHKIKNWQEGLDFVVKWHHNPSSVACSMALHELASVDWVKSVIENATVGNPSWAAYWMAYRKLASPDWAKSIIENDTIGNPLPVARLMVIGGLASQDWYDKHLNTFKRKYKYKN